MKARAGVILAAVGLAALTALFGGIAYAGTSDVLKTKHNLGNPGEPACNVCHTPHDAKGSYLWATNFGAGQGLKPFCYSCHDGSVTNAGAIAFDSTRFQHPVTAGTPKQDCDRCHDPHANTFQFTTLSNLGANMCSSCHGKTGSVNHPIDIVSDSQQPIQRAFDPGASVITGTRLFDAAGSSVITATASGYIKCLTCHASHGAANQALNTVPTSRSTDASAPLCDNCHR